MTPCRRIWGQREEPCKDHHLCDAQQVAEPPALPLADDEVHQGVAEVHALARRAECVHRIKLSEVPPQVWVVTPDAAGVAPERSVVRRVETHKSREAPHVALRQAVPEQKASRAQAVLHEGERLKQNLPCFQERLLCSREATSVHTIVELVQPCIQLVDVFLEVLRAEVHSARLAERLERGRVQDAQDVGRLVVGDGGLRRVPKNWNGDAPGALRVRRHVQAPEVERQSLRVSAKLGRRTDEGALWQRRGGAPASCRQRGQAT
mmetsp:Transcript_36716/g.104468  ORF Transcript_36716/g.104468 Transcript_36716/m.104468 type:complete len:263 (-) Transcript_36716:295-1083(-)